MRVEKGQVVCVLLGISMAFAVFFVEQLDSPLQEGNRLERNFYGQGTREQELMVDGILEKPAPITVSVGERQYEEESAKEALEAAADSLADRILGENPSLREVRSSLILPSWLEEYGISVEWESDDQELLESDGTVHCQNSPPEGKEVALTATLEAGAYADTYVFSVRILPRALTEEEQRMEEFRQILKQMDEGQASSQSLVLPEQYQGKTLRYQVPKENTFLLFPCAGVLAAGLLPLQKKQKEKEQMRKRERQMMMDYPDIVSKLVVFSGAGLPIRKAWERIVREYEMKGEPRAAYEEMAAAYHRMERGMPEFKAYMEFGSRCRCLPYRKLSGLLEQNIRNGSEGLRGVLEAEMENAFEQQKNLARRMGEEASTKLLLPLMMMLLIVMVMVTVPAFLSFGIG